MNQRCSYCNEAQTSVRNHRTKCSTLRRRFQQLTGGMEEALTPLYEWLCTRVENPGHGEWGGGTGEVTFGLGFS